MSRPGIRLRALSARVCSERLMQRLVDPAIADLQAEYETRFAITSYGEAAGSC